MKTKKMIWCMALLLSMPLLVSAQYKKMLDVLEDTQSEQTDGKLSLRFFDANTAEPVIEAKVEIQGIGDFTTDLFGKVMINMQKDAKYAFKFSKEGYVSGVYQFEVVAQTIYYNRFTVCPHTEMGALRIILDWDKSPSDLDLHLVKQGGDHISNQNMKVSSDGNMQLDRDDSDGYGPETITLNKVDNSATYTCYVKDFSHREKNHGKSLSKSKAVLRVYNNNELSDTFYIPKNEAGNKWTVFQIVKGKMVDILKVADGD